MDESKRKEQFSGAYLRAVAAVAGFTVAVPEVDDDSIDFWIGARGTGATPRRPRVEVQLKCTGQDVRRPDGVHFPLSKKNYDDLRAEVLVPRILVVVTVPEGIDDWLAHTEDQLVLRRCGYWMSLAGLPDSTNVDTVTVVLPGSQMLDPNALKGILSRIDHGLPV
jgi:hypothetical protein